MLKQTNAIKIFYESYNRSSSKELFESLENVIKEIEEYDDPSPELIVLYEATNELLEKLSTVGGLLKQMNIERNKTLIGNVLDDLHSNPRHINSNIMFD